MQLVPKQTRFRVALIVGALVIVAAGVFLAVGRRGKPNDLIAVTRGPIAEEVIVTGKTKPVADVDLAFERSGRVIAVNARVGERVSAGAVLVALDQSGLAAEIAEEEANIAVERVRLSNAERTVEEARRALFDKLGDAYTKSDDAVRNRVDQFISNARGPSPQLNFAADPAIESAVELERAAIERMLAEWPGELARVAGSADLEPVAASATANLARVNAFLNQVSLALNGAQPNSSLSQAIIDAWRGDMATARTNVNAATQNISSAREKLGSAPGEVAAKQAEIAAREAKIKTVRVEMTKTLLTSPIGGIITRRDAALGEIITANTPVVALISAQGFEIEANVPEVDIGGVRVGNPVKIVLDAFPDETVPGRVARIDPAETIVDGVVNFKILVAFETGSSRLKSGLTANVAIETQRKAAVLILPQVAIVENDAGSFVRIPNGSAFKELPVTTGIRSQDGLVEILSGVSEGQRVMNVGQKRNRD